MTTTNAENALLDWGVTFRDRDARILRGLLAGLTKHRIHQLTGVARNTIEAVLEEYIDRATGRPVIDTAAVLRAKARVVTGMTAAEFDFSLNRGDREAVTAMNNAAYRLANGDYPEIQPGDGEQVLREHQERAEALWEAVWPEVEAMIARAKTMRFLGWSTEDQVRGRKIRYAD